MKVEITEEEIKELGKVFLILSESIDCLKINWEIISKLLSKLDRPQLRKENKMDEILLIEELESKIAPDAGVIWVD